MNTTKPMDLQMLLDCPAAGMVVSYYADTTVADGFEHHWRQHLKAEARRVREAMAGQSAEAQEFARHLKLIHSALESPKARHARYGDFQRDGLG